MATKTRKTSGRGKAARSAKRGARKGGMRSASKKSARSMKLSAKRRAPVARKAAANSSSPVARVKRVTREVVQQATVAVTAGVETLKGIGENIADRVRAELVSKD